MKDIRQFTADKLANHQVDGNGCWLWLGYCDKNGYGRVGEFWVHRVSYDHFVGSIPAGYEIDHTCQVTRCMNPAHLDAVTRAEHIARTFRRLGKDDRHLAAARLRATGATYQDIAEAMDMIGRKSAHQAVMAAINKGLVAPDDVPMARRLNQIEREEIKDLHAFGVPQTVLGQVYGVDSSHVSRICSGQTSGHGKPRSQREDDAA